MRGRIIKKKNLAATEPTFRESGKAKLYMQDVE